MLKLFFIIVLTTLSLKATPTYDFCKTYLKLDDCVGQIPSQFKTDNDSEMKRISCCFNSLYLDERRLYFCMKREDQVTYWKWFYDQNKQIDKNNLNSGWEEDHKLCCVKALSEAKYKNGCSTTDFGVDSKSDDKLQTYRMCILAKLRAKGTSLRQDSDLTCYFVNIYKFGNRLLIVLFAFIGLTLRI